MNKMSEPSGFEYYPDFLSQDELKKLLFDLSEHGSASFDFIVKRLQDQTLRTFIPNGVKKYPPGHGVVISQHPASECVAYLTVGEGGFNLRFRSDGKFFDKFIQTGSLYILTGDALTKWNHGMVTSKTQYGTRYHIAFTPWKN